MSFEKPKPLYQPNEDSEHPDAEMQQLVWQNIEDTARQMVIDGFDHKPAFVKKSVTRATDRYRLGSEFRPDSSEGNDDFLNALVSRHIEDMDSYEAGSEQHLLRVAELAVYIDAMRGVDYPELKSAYIDVVSDVKKNGAHVGWLAAINRAALLLCDDIGIEKPDNARKPNQKTKRVEGEQTHAHSLRSTVTEIEAQGKITLPTKHALEHQFGLRKPRKDASEIAIEAALRQLGDDIELRKETLRTTKRLTQKVSYSGLLELLTGSSTRKPGELDTLLRNRSLQIKAAKENMDPREIIYAMLETDLHWLTDATVRREVSTSSLEYRKRNGLA